MTIASMADYQSSVRSNPVFNKTAARVQTASQWNTLWDGTGTPAAAALAVGNTAAGLVPTDATIGAPILGFSSGTGYLTTVDATETFSTAYGGARATIYDRLFHAGAYAFNAAVTLAAQPSFSSRVPGGTDYAGLQLWIEAVTGFTGTPSFAVTYTNQAGTAAQTTGTVSAGFVPTIGNMLQLPLASGDCGLQKLESVTASVATAGSFNVIVARPLWNGRFYLRPNIGNIGTQCWLRHWLDRIGMPQLFQDSCLAAMFSPSSGTAQPNFDFGLEVASL